MGEIKDMSDKEKAEVISALLKENRDKKILMAVSQKAVYDQVKETVIVMREVRMTPARERVFEVREVRLKEDPTPD